MVLFEGCDAELALILTDIGVIIAQLLVIVFTGEHNPIPSIAYFLLLSSTATMCIMLGQRMWLCAENRT